MIDHIWIIVLNWLKSHWVNYVTLFMLIGIGLVGGAYFSHLIVGANYFVILLGAISSAIAISGIWFYTIRVPRNKDGKIGLVISITSETEEEQRKIRADFINEIRNVLASVHHDIPFDVVELPIIHTHKITDVESAYDYLQKTKSHFLVYGSIRTRKSKGNQVYSLQLQGMLTHKEIPLEISAVMSNEMKQVLPLKSTISCEDDLKGFDITTTWFSESTKFVIATAAMVSGDLPLAVSLLENVNAAIKKIPKTKQIPEARALKRLVALRLSDVYLNSARHEFSLWRDSHDQNHIEAADKFISAYAMHHKSQDVQFHILKAIYFFVVQKDLSRAIGHVVKCRTLAISDPGWRLNLAFLYAYEGQMDQAIITYNDAFGYPLSTETIFQIEEFMSWALLMDPTKFQLYFCLGLLNLRGKGDSTRALGDFNEFLLRANEGQFQNVVAQAKTYINQIEVSPAV